MSPAGRASWSRRIDALRKEGKLQEALELARHAYSDTPQSGAVKRSYGWVIYARAKEHVDGYFASLQDRSPEAQQRRQSAQTQLNFLLSEYMEAELSRRDLCLSLLLSQATRLRSPPSGLPKVLRWVRVDGLRDEDMIASEGANGTLYPSLLEKLTARLASVAIEREAPRACMLALDWLEATRTRAAPLIKLEELTAHRAPLLRLSGQIEEAVLYARTLLQRSAQDAGAWREWSLCERERDPGLSLWLGVRAAFEAHATLSWEALTLWAEHLAQVAKEAGEAQSALALGLWALTQRETAGAPRHDDTLYLTRGLGGAEALELPLELTLRSLDQRALRLSELALKTPR